MVVMEKQGFHRHVMRWSYGIHHSSIYTKFACYFMGCEDPYKITLTTAQQILFYIVVCIFLWKLFIQCQYVFIQILFDAIYFLWIDNGIHGVNFIAEVILFMLEPFLGTILSNTNPIVLYLWSIVILLFLGLFQFRRYFTNGTVAQRTLLSGYSTLSLIYYYIGWKWGKEHFNRTFMLLILIPLLVADIYLYKLLLTITDKIRTFVVRVLPEHKLEAFGRSSENISQPPENSMNR